MNDFKRSLWWYAHSAIQKRWSVFNKEISTDDMLMLRYTSDRSEKTLNDIELAKIENLECDRELRDYFITI